MERTPAMDPAPILVKSHRVGNSHIHVTGPDETKQVNLTNASVRGSGMYLATGDGTLADAPVTEVRLDGQTGEVLSAQ